jgi:hypothetical protein
VHRHTVRQALASPWPEPRKNYERRSKLDPSKDAIDTMLSAPETAEQAPLTARQVHDRLVGEPVAAANLVHVVHYSHRRTDIRPRSVVRCPNDDAAIE